MNLLSLSWDIFDVLSIALSSHDATRKKIGYKIVKEKLRFSFSNLLNSLKSIWKWFMNYLISSGIHDFHPNHIIKSTFKFGRHIFNRNTLRLPIGFLHSLQIKGCSVIGRTNCFDEKKASQRMNNSRSLCLEVPLPNFWCKYLCRLSQWDQNLFWSHICVFLQVIRHEIHVHFC